VFDLAEMLLKFYFNTAVLTTNKFENKDSNYKISDGFFVPTHHEAHILCPQISTSFVSSKIPNVGKCFGGMTRLLRK